MLTHIYETNGVYMELRAPSRGSSTASHKIRVLHLSVTSRDHAVSQLEAWLKSITPATARTTRANKRKVNSLFPPEIHNKIADSPAPKARGTVSQSISKSKAFQGVWSEDESGPSSAEYEPHKWKLGDIVHAVVPPRDEINKSKFAWVPHHAPGESLTSMAHDWILVRAAQAPIVRKAPPKARIPRLGSGFAKRNLASQRSQETQAAIDHFRRRKETHPVTPVATNPRSKKVVGHPVYGDDAVFASAAVYSDAAPSSSSADRDEAKQAAFEYQVMHDYLEQFLPDQLDVMQAAHGDDMDLDMWDTRPDPS